MIRYSYQFYHSFCRRCPDTDICHAILDLLLNAASTTTSIPTTSPQTPNTPTSPSASTYPYPSSSSASASLAAATQQQLQQHQMQPLFTSDQLTRLKIYLRERPHPYPSRERGPIPGRDQSLFFRDVPAGAGGSGRGADGDAGKAEGTVRFLFGPQG